MGYINLKAELKRKGITYKDLSKILMLSRNTITKKMECITRFDTSEVNKIKTELFKDEYSYDYLFKEK